MPTAYPAATAGSLTHKAAGYHLSADLAAVILFSLTGLAASAALLTGMNGEALSFFLGAF